MNGRHTLFQLSNPAIWETGDACYLGAESLILPAVEWAQTLSTLLNGMEIWSDWRKCIQIIICKIRVISSLHVLSQWYIYINTEAWFACHTEIEEHCIVTLTFVAYTVSKILIHDNSISWIIWYCNCFFSLCYQHLQKVWDDMHALSKVFKYGFPRADAQRLHLWHWISRTPGRPLWG